MVSTDPIADMLTRIRNAIAVNRYEVEVPYSRLKSNIAAELAKSGFIVSVKEDGKEHLKNLIITLNKPGTSAKITSINRVSKPGRRVYSKVEEIPSVKNGRGLMLLSTSKGIMTGEEAQAANLGGELICKVY